MTLLTIVQGASDQVNAPDLATVAANADPSAKKMLRIVNKCGTRLMKSIPWQILRKERTFTTISGETQTGILPSDFDRFVSETFRDRTANAKIDGPTSAVQWQDLKAQNYSGSRRKFVYRGGAIAILPAYSAGSTLAFEYISKNWCQASDETPQTAFAADTDTAILDEELLTLATVYEFLESEGLPSDAALRAYMKHLKTLVNNDQPASGVLSAGDIFGGRHFTGAPAADNVESLL